MGKLQGPPESFHKRESYRKSWRDLCQSVESAKDTSRLRNFFFNGLCSADQSGAWTGSNEETNSILLDTRFPGNSKLPKCSFAGGQEVMDDDIIDKIINTDTVKWAIHSFESYKSPGLDGIFPKMLQETELWIIPKLTKIFKACLKLGYVQNL